MGYNFSTIEGLFRPNYQVFTSPLTTSETESKHVKPMLVTHYPQSLERVKSVLTEALVNVHKQEAENLENNQTEMETPEGQEEEVVLTPN